MNRSKTLVVCCPDCDTRMRVDAATGKVLSHEAAKSDAPKQDFDRLLAGLDASKSRADDVFRQELEALEDRDRLMEEKFREALRRAEDEDDGKPPVRPWDLD
ncbi:MAG: hypothetical protein AAGD06_00105 [Acidobacteriota bacterium]